MLDITARNVNFAYPEALWRMKILGVEADSRNGRVRRFPGPVATTYMNPTERMLLNPRRDANPFFHIFEGVWMLAGRNDTWTLGLFNQNIGQFSDDGATFHGAYGHRWRHHFGHDQILWAIETLKADPNSRRVVLQMFDPVVDQYTRQDAKDIPCNVSIFFEVDRARLNMTVTNRSNDMIWGCYGANAVHMSMLMEFVANALDLTVGHYVQFSNNLHIYERHFDLLERIDDVTTHVEDTDPHVPITRAGNYMDDLYELERWSTFTPNHWEYDNPYVIYVLEPMLKAWSYYKRDDKMGALESCELIGDSEVREACYQWLLRRKWRTQR